MPPQLEVYYLEAEKFNLIIFTWIVMGKPKSNKIKLAMTIALMIGTFFNPLGFDALFRAMMNWTGSYWITDIIFYCLSGLFFGLYFLLRKWDNNYINKV